MVGKADMLRTVQTLFVLRPTNGQERHKAFFKVGPDVGP